MLNQLESLQNTMYIKFQPKRKQNLYPGEFWKGTPSIDGTESGSLEFASRFPAMQGRLSRGNQRLGAS